MEIFIINEDLKYSNFMGQTYIMHGKSLQIVAFSNSGGMHACMQ